ncbi:unnamed protein product [Lactuca saligna]|uniref:Uncharacterized protein n=1 Tax=Lactuca saligna TaxID=75948 RepID=A0AA35ZR07_LACSI|nr:unnamed protein product [Lactuca saligna]
MFDRLLSDTTTSLSTQVSSTASTVCFHLLFFLHDPFVSGKPENGLSITALQAIAHHQLCLFSDPSPTFFYTDPLRSHDALFINLKLFFDIDCISLLILALLSLHLEKIHVIPHTIYCPPPLSLPFSRLKTSRANHQPPPTVVVSGWFYRSNFSTVLLIGFLDSTSVTTTYNRSVSPPSVPSVTVGFLSKIKCCCGFEP